MQTIYTSLKVNNEIELCEISDVDCKHLIEQELLKRRISYFIRWPKKSWFRRSKDICIICVNENVKEEAENIVRNICDEKGYTIRFILKRAQNDFL